MCNCIARRRIVRGVSVGAPLRFPFPAQHHVCLTLTALIAFAPGSVWAQTPSTSPLPAKSKAIASRQARPLPSAVVPAAKSPATIARAVGIASTTSAKTEGRATTSVKLATAPAAAAALSHAVPVRAFPLPKGARLANAQSAVTYFAAAPVSALLARYQDSKAERRLYVRSFDRDLLAGFELAMATRDPVQKAAVERGLRASLGTLIAAKSSALETLVTTRGGVDGSNFDARDAALHFAMLYRLTGDVSHATRSAAILRRFAIAIPAWPIWNPFYGAESAREPVPQTDPSAFSGDFCAGIWGSWIHMDLVLGTPLVHAYSLIAPSGATASMGADAKIMEMFDLHLSAMRRFSAGADYCNMDAFRIRGLMDFGRFLGRPELVHEAVRQFRDIYAVGFRADGWWNEASSSYHADLHNGLRMIADELLHGYSDPPGFVSKVDGLRYDNIDLATMFAEQLGSSANVLRKVTLPDRTLLATNETQWPEWAPSGIQAQGSSFLFGATGIGGLATGSGDNITIANMQWGGTGTHAHFDSLGLGIFAKGVEAISLGQYQPIPGSGSTRTWHQSTASHATVVVDERNQAPYGPLGSRAHVPVADDAVPGLADWRWRWGPNSVEDAGSLRLFHNEFDRVKVMEAEAYAAYDMVAGVTTYRRTVAIVKIDEFESYIVDIFRVRGGSVHDYVLHGALHCPYSLSVSVPLEAIPGTIHGSIRNLRGAVTDSEVSSTMDMAGGVHLVTRVLGAPRTQLIVGDAPAARREGSAPYLIIRRTGGDSTFGAVHQVHRGGHPAIVSVEALPTDSPDSFAMRIVLPNRVDTVISNATRDRIHTVGNGIHVRALFAHHAEASTPTENWDYMVDGNLFSTPTISMIGEVSHWGSVVGTNRVDAGSGINAIALSPPVSSSATSAGLPLIVDFVGRASWSYAISGRARAGVLVPHDPGFVILGSQIKQTRFPNWGFRGVASYRIPGSARAQLTPSGALQFAQTRNAQLLAKTRSLAAAK
jgi:hypothetical protein